MGSTRLRSWSFSTWDRFANGCKRRVRYQKIDKLPDPPGPQMARGNRIHKQLEDYLLYENQPFPSSFPKTPNSTINEMWREEVDALVEEGAEAEREIALSDTWEGVDWRAGWLRLKVDASWVNRDKARIVDYKTGKIYDSSKKQLELYAVVFSHLHPKVKYIDAELWYLDQGEIIHMQLDRQSLGEKWSFWDEAGRAITTEEEWEPSPSSWNCRYCPYAASKGGPCKYG